MESIATSKPASPRQSEIARDFLVLLDRHMEELKQGQANRTMELNEFADALHIHPTHLSNTIHEVLQCSPCSIYEEKLMNIARELLLTTNKPIGVIAGLLTYDPSNFTKFFKHYEGITPKAFRLQHVTKN